MKYVKDIFATSLTFSANTALLAKITENADRNRYGHISSHKLQKFMPIQEPHATSVSPSAIQYHLNGAFHSMDTSGYIPKQTTIY